MIEIRDQWRRLRQRRRSEEKREMDETSFVVVETSSVYGGSTQSAMNRFRSYSFDAFLNVICEVSSIPIH